MSRNANVQVTEIAKRTKHGISKLAFAVVISPLISNKASAMYGNRCANDVIRPNIFITTYKNDMLPNRSEKSRSEMKRTTEENIIYTRQLK